MEPRLNIRKFILEWNSRWPMDRYIRKKYGIAFGSTEHRAMNFIDMAIEFAEDRVLANEEEKSMRLNERTFEEAVGLVKPKTEGNQEEMKPVRMTQREIAEEFDNIDLAKFND